MGIKIYIRYPVKGAGHSIEELFCTLSNNFNPPIKLTELPFPTNSVWKVLKNILYVRKTQSHVNHISGDCHYALLGVSSKNKSILTVHDCVIISRLSKWHPKFWIFKWFWFDLPVKKADAITVISEKTKKELLSFIKCNNDKIHVIPNFVNPIFKRKNQIEPSAKPVILQVGTKENKNLLRVIKALESMPCRLLILGNLSEIHIFSLIQNKIDYENYFNIDQKEVVRLYHEADLLIFASTYEGFGMPIIEAQACGTPVITSNLSPMSDVAGEGALLVNPFDIKDIRKAVNTILFEDPTLSEKIIEKGFINSSKYSLNRVTKQYENLYNFFL